MKIPPVPPPSGDRVPHVLPTTLHHGPGAGPRVGELQARHGPHSVQGRAVRGARL